MEQKKSLPFRIDPPTLRWVVGEKDPCAIGKDSCGTCKYFSSTPLASPGGWCAKYRCQQVNCGIGMICGDWKSQHEPALSEGKRISLDDLSWGEIKRMAEAGKLQKGSTKTIEFPDGSTALAAVISTDEDDNGDDAAPHSRWAILQIKNPQKEN